MVKLYALHPLSFIKLSTGGAIDLLLIYGVDRIRRCNDAASGSIEYDYPRSSQSDKELAKLQALVMLASEKQMMR